VAVNPEELLYAKTHEWVHIEDDGAESKLATMGLSAFAVEALTDLVFIELPEVGREVHAGESFGEVESVKAVSDIYAPIDGTIEAVNDRLPDDLETLSSDPYGAGWIAKIRIADAAMLAGLVDYAAYQARCREEL
jgi:glycine cleavage system H protein